jgi:hypothetical protein
VATRIKQPNHACRFSPFRCALCKLESVPPPNCSVSSAAEPFNAGALQGHTEIGNLAVPSVINTYCRLSSAVGAQPLHHSFRHYCRVYFWGPTIPKYTAPCLSRVTKRVLVLLSSLVRNYIQHILFSRTRQGMLHPGEQAQKGTQADPQGLSTLGNKHPRVIGNNYA